MATLTSPGVSVTISDESAYASPGAGTVPLIILATANDKTDPTGAASDGIAASTKSSAANVPVLVTSQRELSQKFGNVSFASTAGAETSEYGLLAAYSFLGQGGSAYIQRADIDLSALTATTTEPTAAYSTAASMWLDTNASKYGIHQYDNSTGLWNNVEPTVEVNLDATASEAGGDNYTPSATVVDGDFLVVVHGDQDGDLSLEYFYGVSSAWEVLDSDTALSSGETVTYAPHYSLPSAPSDDDIWIKTTRPANGIDLKIYTFSNSKFNLQTVIGVTSALTAGKSTAIGDFRKQDGTSTSALAASDVSENQLLLDLEANTKAVITIQQVDADDAPEDLSAYSSKLAQNDTPTATAADGTYWHDSTINSLDLYKATSSGWEAVTATYSSSEPTSPSGGDVWVDTTGATGANERAYPVIYVYNSSLTDWVKHSNTDQTTERGVLFADITDTAGDNTDSGYATVITNGPSHTVYPVGMMAVNMGQSKNTVRSYNTTAGAWRNAAANHADGSGAFGRLAQRKVVASKLQAAAAASELLEETIDFKLIAAPGYPELADEMYTISNNRNNTAFVIVDSPLRKTVSEAITWVNGTSADENGEDGLNTKNTYAATYYPALKATNPTDGKTVVTYASHSVLYQYAYNDSISYEWFAPAGLNRGVVTNASGVGYIDDEGEFKALSLNSGDRDKLYAAKLNPIANFPGTGIVLYGQKSLHATTTALDRVNVARLVAHLRGRFDEIARPFLFEQNDQLTRDRARLVFNRFLENIASQRGITDFAVVCDESNNTPARIDANELYIDIAIAPTKSIEFIYIPVRIVATGTL